MHSPVVMATVLLTWLRLSQVSGQLQINEDQLNGQVVIDDGLGRYDNRPRSTPRYMVLASGTVRPGTVYRVVVVLLDLPSTGITDFIKYPLHVRTSIARDGVEISSGKKNMNRADMQTVLMQIPDSATGGEYRLRVEGDHYGSTGGGSVFVNETRLQFSQRFLTVLIQTSRPMYNFGQMIRFRVVMLKTNLRPFDDPVEVFVLDSDGYIMRRWTALSSNNGVVSLKLRLPPIGKGGWWTIRVVVRGQITEKQIRLTKYFSPQWEVFVLTETFYLLSDEFITGEIAAGYTNDQSVRGNATVELWVRPELPASEFEREFKLVAAYRIPEFDSSETVSIPMQVLQGSISQLNNAKIKLIARVRDYWYNETYVGFCSSKLINSSISIRILGTSPQFFKPGMPFYGQVLVTYHDNAPLSPEDLQKSVLTIRSSSGMEIRIPSVEEQKNRLNMNLNRGGNFSWTGGPYGFVGEDPDDDGGHFPGIWSSKKLNELMMEYLDSQEWAEYRSSGLYRFRMDMPYRSSPIELTASFQGADSAASSTSLRLEPFHSVSRRFISIETSNQVIDVGEYAVFHVRSNFPMKQFYYVVLSKNLVIYADLVAVEDSIGSTVKTVSVAVSSEMPPSFRVLVCHVTDDGEVLTDTVHVPVESINKGTTRIVLNQQKDHSKNTVELGVWSTPGSSFGTSSTRSYLYSVQAGHDLTRTSVLAELHSFEITHRGIHQAMWRWRDGHRPAQSDHYITPSYGADTNNSFTLSGLVLLTDAMVETSPNSDCGADEMRCLTRGCFNVTSLCDGIDDCPDRSDESACSSPMDSEMKERKFRLTRRSYYNDLFDQDSGDWAWTLQNIGHQGSELTSLEVPETNDDWFVNGFSISEKDGFGLVEQPLPYQSNRPFYMTMEIATKVRRGETLVARMLLVNNQDMEALAMIVLKGSPQYQFVHVEAYGIVSHIHARTSSGDHQHLVPVPAGGVFEVSFPIKPLVELGTIDVTVECITQFSLDVKSETVEIIMEGVPIGKHTSILLDLKNRAINHKFFYVFTEQSPESLFDPTRSYVYGSPQASVLVSGDVVGPIFPSVPMTTGNVFGKALKSVDGSVFNFGYNIWSLHYLRMSNQLSTSFLRKVLVAISPQFILIMKRFRQGAFLFFDGGYPSVWTTAWTIRQLHYSQFQDWENYLYVEPRIMAEAAQWITLYQNVDGSFNETEWYQIPLDQKMSAESRVAGENHRRRHVPLTAHVLISLHQVIDKVQGDAKSVVTSAKRLAMQYLERVLPILSDPYEIAITAYALTVSNSVERGAAFSSLQATVRTELSGMYYWARERLDTNPLSVGTNQRPYLQAKNEQVWDAQAVEATSYALLVYVLRNGVSVDQERIVTWLNTMRMYNGGWISTVDTLLALQALTEYSYRARLRDVTDMNVEVEFSSSQSRHIVQITRNNTAEEQSVPLDKVWGYVNIMGRGAGQAVVQMDLSFGIDQESLKDSPPKPSFFLSIREKPIQTARNKSIVFVEASLRWINVEESATSGAAILEVEFPSGYRIDQQVVNAMVVQHKQGPLPNLMSGKTASDRIFWFFDRVHSNYTQYFNWTIYRRYLISNYTAFRSARLYEYFAPERFEMQILNSTELNVVDICQVCGSYQCPYCPWYSGTVILNPSALLSMLGCLVIYAMRTGW